MRTLLSRTIQIDPSFHIALGIIVVLGIAEIFFATSYYVGAARATGSDDAFVNRLKLDAAGVRAMADGVRQVAALPDPGDRQILALLGGAEQRVLPQAATRRLR